MYLTKEQLKQISFHIKAIAEITGNYAEAVADDLSNGTITVEECDIITDEYLV